MLFKHGISPAISRGSSLGLAKHFADMNTKNIATCSVSVANLVNRAALEPYLRSTANDYVRKFKYDPTFVDRYIAPVVAWHYQGAQLGEVNSLASGFTLLDSDFANADANVRLSTISPDNATLCTALIQAASATLNVDVKLTTTVTRVEYKEAESKYVLTYGNAQTAEFDGVVLCASPKEGDMIIDTSVGNSLSELLGYDRDTQAAGGHMEDEARNVADRAEEHIAGDKEPAVAAATCSHFAVVVGKANASFFRFSEESHIPDLVQITHAPGCSRFERIREYCDNMPGVYTVLCGPDFESSGLFSEMFEDESELRYHEAMSESRYTHSAVPEGKEIDDCMPYIVLGNRFVYAAATRRLAKHPEVDAMSAVNTASLFSRAVEWASSEKEDGWCRKQLIPHAFIEVAIQAPLPEGMSHRSEWML